MPRKLSSCAAWLADMPDSSYMTGASSRARHNASSRLSRLCSLAPPSLTPRTSLAIRSASFVRAEISARSVERAS